MGDKIYEGDFVNVYFNTTDVIFDAEIIYIPCVTGDCFKLKDKNGKLYNVQTYNYMEKIEPNGRTMIRSCG